MVKQLNPRYVVALLVVLCGLIELLIGPVAAAALLGGFCILTGWFPGTAPGWVVAAPLFYLVWLLLLLGFYSIETTLLNRWSQKPRRLEERSLVPSFQLLLINRLYGRYFLLFSLPLVERLSQLPLLDHLVSRAYSGSVHRGMASLVYGAVLDPDLTRIGRGVVVGHGTRLVAHGLTRNRRKALVFQSAPIEIGAFAVIGGGCEVEMGASIGEGAMVERFSLVPAFAKIPDWQVWGGNPATFRRHRDGVSTTPGGVDSVTLGDVSIDEVCRTIAQALTVAPEKVRAEGQSSDLEEWDSLGCMAIAAALHNRFGLVIPAGEAMALNSIAGILERIAAGRTDVTVDPDFCHPDLLTLIDPGVATSWLAAKRPAGRNEMIREKVVVAASFTAEPLAPSLRLWTEAFGIDVEVVFAGFQQTQQALRSLQSPFAINSLGVNVLLVRVEDLIVPEDPGGAEALTRYAEALDGFFARHPGRLIVGDLASTSGGGDLPDRWRAMLAGYPQVDVLAVGEIIASMGSGGAYDLDSDRVAAAPYTPPVYQQLGRSLARKIRCRHVPARKVIAVDADQTLWGGVVGEDGVDRLDFSGPFARLQEVLLRLKNEGALLVLVSRNEEEDVQAALTRHPDAVLRWQDFAATRVNWQAKSSNLRSLAEELNVGLDAFVFLDDNPAEQREVLAHAPEVLVVPLSRDAAEYAPMLERMWVFDRRTVTVEDRQRTAYMHDEKERHDLLAQTGDMTAYLRSLELWVTLRPPDPADLERAAQLTQKTNQFNLTLRRRTVAEIRELLTTHSVMLVEAGDRFGGYGIIGLLAIRREAEVLEIDTFLLSCRALGRGIEDVLLRWIFQEAVSVSRLAAPDVSGPRNQPVREFFATKGFALADGQWLCTKWDGEEWPSHLKVQVCPEGNLQVLD